eukprot:749773-Hanusia_phi.AAC.1
MRRAAVPPAYPPCRQWLLGYLGHSAAGHRTKLCSSSTIAPTPSPCHPPLPPPPPPLRFLPRPFRISFSSSSSRRLTLASSAIA